MNTLYVDIVRRIFISQSSEMASETERKPLYPTINQNISSNYGKTCVNSNGVEKTSPSRSNPARISSQRPSEEMVNISMETSTLDNTSSSGIKGWVRGRGVLTLVVLCVANFGTGCGFFLPAPFYPREARSKGVAGGVIGAVFSSFQVAMFVGAPVFGQFLTRIGPKCMYTTGVLVAGTCSIAFGFLDRIESQHGFVSASFVLRVLEGLAVIACFLSSAAVVIHEFPDHVGTVYAILETCIGIGMMIGPTIGAGLYSLGGFGLPFWVIGGWIVVGGLVVLCWLPQYTESSPPEQSYIALLRSPRVATTCLCVFAGAAGMGFLEPTLAAHLETFGLTTLQVGLSFAVMPGVHAFVSPMWGCLNDKYHIQSSLMVAGAVMSVVAYLMVGPSPVLPFMPRRLWLVYVALALVGVTFGLCVVPPMASLVHGARELGFPDNLDTFGLVSGLFNAFFCLGSLTGPLCGGVLVDAVGFAWATSAVAAMFLFVSVVSACAFGVLGRCGRGSGDGEAERLLNRSATSTSTISTTSSTSTSSQTASSGLGSLDHKRSSPLDANMVQR